MDPVTAALNALAAFNQFLLTPPGQKLAINAEDVVTNIFRLFNVHLSAGAPK